MQTCSQITAVLLSLALFSTAAAGLTATRQGKQIIVSGDHFRIKVDAAAGGEIVDIQLFDGSGWNRVLGADGQTCPMVKISDGQREYHLAHDRDAAIEDLQATADLVRFRSSGTPRTKDRQGSPWRVSLKYEIHAEGAVFIDVDYQLTGEKATLTGSSLSFVVDRKVTQAAKYRDGTHKSVGLPTARVAFGMNPARSFTNEIQAVIEDKTPMAGSSSLDQGKGRFSWSLADGQNQLDAPYGYRNRFALGLGAAATGRPRSNVIAQRVYHWINWFREDIGKEWYPSNEQIDKMGANGATMLIMHHYWIQQAGSNGRPHADYRTVRDHDQMQRAIARAHERGLRVGLYMRGIERYGLAAGQFQRYCRRNWDGLYVDWHGVHCVSHHEHRNKPQTTLGDTHLSADGSHLAARKYFLFTKKLRQLVGPGGFLIGHQGFGNSGILANLAFDGYLPGESGSDHAMFHDMNTAVYQGMLGGVTCMPWTLDSAAFISREGIAKMAAWGFYPHACLGFQRSQSGTRFATDPDDPSNGYVLPYWRVLRAVDAERVTVYNLPSVNVLAARSSNLDFHCVVYKEAGEGDASDTYLVIVANLRDNPQQTTLTLVPEVLGLSGDYHVHRVDAESGKLAPAGESAGTITTSRLPAWGIEGFKLSKVK